MDELDFSNYQHFHMVDTIVNALSKRIHTHNRDFFVILACYNLTKLAANMHVSIDAGGLGKLLVNMFAFNTAPSGFGKDYSQTIISKEVCHLFNTRFTESTLPIIAERSLNNLAVKRAMRNNTTDDEELVAVMKEYHALGKHINAFDSGTSPGIKQFRHRILMGEIGALNLEINEIGNNLLSNGEALNIYLELYEGEAKPKLIKNTKEELRNEEIVGKTPTNMMLYGTPSALLDADAAEKAFKKLLQTGYGRRCFFGHVSEDDHEVKRLSFDERMSLLKDVSIDKSLSKLAIDLQKFADPINHKFVVKVPDDVLEEIVRYMEYCENTARSFKKTDSLRIAEALNRHYKTLKLAGTFAFLDSSIDMKVEHFQAAVKVAEMSGACFDKLLRTNPPHIRLAEYLAECGTQTTLAELVEELPSFPSASNQQKDILKLATAYGYKNNIIIKRSFIDDIEFIHGEPLEETDLNQLRLSWVADPFIGASEGYTNEHKVPFNRLDVITKMQDGHWCNHGLVDGNRKEVIKGFNMIVIDVDENTPLTLVQSLLKEYTYHIYTTKSHQIVKGDKPACDRFRIILPTNYVLYLGEDEFKEFMHNIFEFLPFDSDEKTGQANRKWLSNPNAQVYTNEGELFDVLPFIPKTKKNEVRKGIVDSISSMDAFESYFYQIAEPGNRNNTLFRYGAALLDAGYRLDEIIAKIQSFNKKLPKSISVERLESTIIKSLTNKYCQKG